MNQPPLNYINDVQALIDKLGIYIGSFRSKKGKGMIGMHFSPHDPNGAYAQKTGNDKDMPWYLIYISEPMLYLIHEYLKVFLSDNDLFSGIGHSSSLIKVSSVRERDILQLEFDIRTSNNDKAEFDTNRRELHNLLFTIMGKYIAVHEFTHIINGHVDLLADYSQRRVKLSSLDKQTLELDADACVIGVLYEDYTRYKNDVLGIPILKDEKSILYCLFFCNLLLMSIFSYHSMTIEILTNKIHPNPYMRHMIVFSTLVERFAREEKSLSLLDDVFGNVLQDFFKSYRKIVEEKDLDEFQWTFNSDNIANDYVLNLAKHWNTLRPQLEKYAMVELSPLYVDK